jgi:transcriptional regulator with XRE-family HTH domain
MNSIGYNLRTLRFKHNLTQQQVSETTGISVHLINQYEADKEFPEKDEIQRLADFYEVEIMKILIGE